MTLLKVSNCPGTLKEGYTSYSSSALRRLFNRRKVDHILPYESPANSRSKDETFGENQNSLSISGVQEKFSVLLDKNKLRLTTKGERGTHILKPIPNAGNRADQMPANEHLTMQIASQIFNISTAENALIFFKDGSPAYITKRFDVRLDGNKWAQEDFAAIAGRTPQTHGEHFKYEGNYYQLFELLKSYVPAYIIEAIKLFKLILFNYLISNGDAHFKNFSLIETPLGDFKLSPAYDLLNSRIHIEDSDFALKEGLLPIQETKGKVREQFYTLGKMAGIPQKQIEIIIEELTGNSSNVLNLIELSYLNEKTKRNYRQAYQTRLKKLLRK